MKLVGQNNEQEISFHEPYLGFFTGKNATAAYLTEDKEKKEILQFKIDLEKGGKIIHDDNCQYCLEVYRWEFFKNPKDHDIIAIPISLLRTSTNEYDSVSEGELNSCIGKELHLSWSHDSYTGRTPHRGQRPLFIRITLHIAQF